MGRTVEVTATGYPATTDVMITLEALTLGTTTTDGEGAFSATYTDIDCAINGGTLTATAGDSSASSNVTLEPCQSPTTTAAPEPTTSVPAPTTVPDQSPTTTHGSGSGTTAGGLPATGAAIAPLVAAGIVLVTSGAGAAALATRRRRSGNANTDI